MLEKRKTRPGSFAGATLATMAVTVILLVSRASAQPPASAAPPRQGPGDALWGNRVLGEACMKDCQCESKECDASKKCVERDYKKHPLLPQGKLCRFDGDCESCDCAGNLLGAGRCH